MSSLFRTPEKVFIVGLVRVTLWNASHPSTGHYGPTDRRITIERDVSSATAGFRKSDTFLPEDIPQAILALRKAFDYVHGRAPEPNDDQPQETLKAAPHIP